MDGAREAAVVRTVTIGSLFSGVAGLERGVEFALSQQGVTPRVVFQVEFDPWCRTVLARHYPDAVRYGDIRSVGAELGHVDVVCLGFPCQPASVAGQRKGREDDRWLWPEARRVLALVRPRIVFVENVPGLLSVDDGHGFAEVLGDLAALGYDAEWGCFRASDVGAPHRRERVFIYAYLADTLGCEGGERYDARLVGRRSYDPEQAWVGGGRGAVGVGHPDGGGLEGLGLRGLLDGERAALGHDPDRRGGADGRGLADTDGGRSQRADEGRECAGRDAAVRSGEGCEVVAHSDRGGCGPSGLDGVGRAVDAGRDAADLAPAAANTGAGGHRVGVGLADASCAGPREDGARGERSGRTFALGGGQVGVDLVDPDRQPLEGAHGAPVAATPERAGTLVSGGVDGGPRTEPRLGCGASRLPTGLVQRPGGDLDAHQWPAGRGEPQHPHEPPRTSAHSADRRAKLKAYGNAVVSQCAALAWRVLSERAAQTGTSVNPHAGREVG